MSTTDTSPRGAQATDGNTADDAGDDAVVQDAPVVARAAHDGRQRHFPCRSCGSQLAVAVGATLLRCPACGAEEAIPLSEAAIRERSLDDWQPPDHGRGLDRDDHVPLVCAGCGAAVDALPEIANKPCPYCGGHLQRKDLGDSIKPEAVVPFRLDAKAAETAIRRWIAKLWFAPNDLKDLSHLEGFRDVYLPWFTFDTHTVSHYKGEAGHHYYVTVGSGKNRRTVRRTRWHWRSGVHEEFIDDELVMATPVSGTDRSWKTQAAKPYGPELLAGTTALRATSDPKRGWQEAKATIESRLYATCTRKIGGDTQRRVSVVTAHRGITWKLVLLPRWEGGYRYRNRRFTITVNGQTGVVQGARPWSVTKFVLLGVSVAVVIAIVVVVVLMQQRQEAAIPAWQPHSSPPSSQPWSPPHDLPVER